jgi:molybdenum cofactor cytidylyltransferase
VKPGLVLLAAGQSARLGETKALVDLGGTTPLERLLRAGSILDELPALVVSGAAHREIARALPRDVEIAHNQDWRKGRTGGVHLAALRRPGADLCLAPVDVPLVPGSVFEALQERWASAGSPGRGWLAPRYGEIHGHPVIVGRELLVELEQFGPDRPLRELRGIAEPLLSVEVESREILDDLDTPEDLEVLRRLVWGG